MVVKVNKIEKRRGKNSLIAFDLENGRYKILIKCKGI
jgi:hypothetical protein